MSQTRMYTPIKLWSTVQDVLEYWGDGNEKLAECRLVEGATKNSYILQVPKELIELVEQRLDAIEDALEQLLLEHQVDVYVMVREESMEKSRGALVVGSARQNKSKKEEEIQ